MAELASGVLPREYTSWDEVHGQSRQMWPSPAAADGERSSDTYMGGNATLLGAVRAQWPTPNADNAVGGRNYKDDGTKYRPHGTYGMTLVDATALWMTPTSADGSGGKVAPAGETNTRTSKSGKKVQYSLKQQTREIWPTPQTRDYRTPDAFDSHGANRKREQGWSPNLNDTALWSTPAAQDSKNGALPPSQARRDTLPGDVIRSGVAGTLNADWVECLQGLPVGWTDATVTTLNAANARDAIQGWPSGPAESQHDWEPARVVVGRQSKRQQRLKALGNLAMPQQFADVFAAIVAVSSAHDWTGEEEKEEEQFHAHHSR